MTAQSRVKAQDQTLVPNTALEERPEPVSERSFPEREEAAASNRHGNREGKAASTPRRLKRVKRQSNKLTL